MERIGIDLIGPTLPDVHGRTLLVNSKDLGSGYRDCNALADKLPTSVLLAYNDMYPGTRWDQPPQCPKELGVDSGTEFLGEFCDGVSKRGTKVVPGLPHRSETNAVEGQRRVAAGRCD